MAAVPKIAASVVTAQLAYVPYNAPQYAATFNPGGSLTSVHTAPKATRNVPFITPSRCAARPMRGFLKLCSAKPMRRPSRNRNIPCQSNRRLKSVILIPLYSSLARTVDRRQKPRIEAILAASRLSLLALTPRDAEDQHDHGKNKKNRRNGKHSDHWRIQPQRPFLAPRREPSGSLDKIAREQVCPHREERSMRPPQLFPPDCLLLGTQTVCGIQVSNKRKHRDDSEYE